MAPKVVLSYGLGVDSTAILLRWINDPSSRDFDLSDLMVITAMTGDEWALSGTLVEQHVLPLMAEHGIRYVQVARRTESTTDIIVLDDSTAPDRLYIEGAYKLSDEMFSAGTIPQRGGARLCSAKSKGDVLDTFILREMNGRQFRHVVGFEADETGRAKKDCGYNEKGRLAGQRTGEYPLIEWGWTRDDCLDYIYHYFQVAWPKSACTFCPFALENKASRVKTLERFEASPVEASHALLMESVALSLNPSQQLCSAGPLADLVEQHTWEVFEKQLRDQEHALYEVRRVLRPHKEDPTRLANAARAVKQMARGTRDEMIDTLYLLATRVGREVEWSGRDRDMHHRLWMLPRPSVFPGVEQMLTIAPAIVPDKQLAKFEQWWIEASQAQRRLALAS